MVVLAASRVPAAQYQLRLPLQYDRYLPWSARALGMGGASMAGGGALSLYGLPDGTSQVNRWEAAATATMLSAGRSHVSIESGKTETYPSAMAAAVRLGAHRLAAGYRRALDDHLTFPDVYDPRFINTADLELDQAVVGWSYSNSGNASLGLSLSYNKAEFNWRNPDSLIGMVTGGRATGYGISAGVTIPVTSEMKLSLAAAAKSEIKGTNDYLPDPAPDDLELSGAVPSRTSLALAYRPEPGFTAAAEAVMTGWNGVTQSYEGQIDFHLGAEAQVLPSLTLRLGVFTKMSPLDNLERRLNQSLHDLYFLSVGLGLSWRGFLLDLGGASSRPLSGLGQNQNILAATVGYCR
jgi:hypothetical protein